MNAVAARAGADILVHAYASPESAMGGDFVIATYAVELPAGDDADRRIAGLAIGQSIGTWTEVPGINAEMLARHVGRVIGIYELPAIELTTQLDGNVRRYIARIAFPTVNVGRQWPMLMTVLLGNDVSTSAQVKLLDLDLPASFAEALGGPRHGIAGIRARTGVDDRALILNVIKPNLGFDAETGAAMFAEAARGGCDIVKDDELLGNPSFSGVLRRVTAYRQAADRVFEDTGHRALYCANVTERPDRLFENARRAVELGVDMVMINAVSSGLGVLEALAALDLGVPILAHYAGAGAMTENPAGGLSSPLLLGKLMRLCGADAVSFNSPYSAYPLPRSKYVETARRMRLPLHTLKPSLPVPGGGIHPATAAQIVCELGNDVLLAVGGAIQGHPQGAAAGARAMRQAVDAAATGEPLAVAAEAHSELAAALAKWRAPA